MIKCALGFFLLAAVSSVFATEECPKEPSEKNPLILGGCMGEGCEFIGYNKALRKVDLHERASSSSKVVGNLQKCEPFTQQNFVTVVKKFGKANIITRRPDHHIQLGDEVPVIKYLELDQFSICHKGKLIIGSAQKAEKGIPELRIKEPLEAEVWILVKNQKGVEGYAAVKDHPYFYMTKYDYDESKLCPEDRKAEAAKPAAPAMTP